MGSLVGLTVLELLCTACISTTTASVASTDNPAAELRDRPPVGQTLRYLDGVWSASSSGGSTGVEHTINASVPGDVITDLEAAGLIGDPWFETNWRDDAGMWFRKWRYSTTFALSSAEIEQLRAGAELFLVFDGIKMGATIELDGQAVGVATDQWLRYSFPISKLLGPAALHELSVTFDNAIDTHGRYMGCSGGWDWAPMSMEWMVTPDRSPTFSFGIWKSVALLAVNSTSITHVAPRVFATEQRVAPAAARDWEVEVAVHFDTPGIDVVGGELQVEGDWGAVASLPVKLQPGESVVTINITANKSQVKLWWPVRMGEQPLYNLTVLYKLDTGSELVTTRRIGFREFHLTTSDPTADDDDANGSGNHSLVWVVNGMPIWSRGANIVPMEELEGRASALALQTMVESAAAGNMNTLRIWGGGLFFYDAFYDRADELGLLILHDLMFIEQGHGPCCPFYGAASGWSNAGHTYNVSCECKGEVEGTQKAELLHQLRRLSPHPSIVVWDACNECGGFGLYSDFVMTTVAQEDRSRPIWPSCPSNGWVSGVFRGTGLPNGKPLITSPGKTNDTRPCTACQCGLSGCSEAEMHGPYLGGSGFITDEKGRGYNASHPEHMVPIKLFEPANPPKFQVSQTGVAHPGNFNSEFGAVTMASFESLSATLKPEHWSLHSAPFQERNWPADGIIASFFGNNSRDALIDVGAKSLQRQVYQSMLGQALWIKSEVETARASNIWGKLTWQLNDVYPSGSWGSLEYGPLDRPGQVVGGRWKVLHYMHAQSIFADLLPACSASGNCYMKNDGNKPFAGLVNVSFLHLATGEIEAISSTTVSLPAGAGVLWPFCADGSHAKDFDATCKPLADLSHKCMGVGGKISCMLILDAIERGGSVATHNLVALAPPKSLVLPNTTVTATVADKDNTAVVRVEAAGGVALYVVLTTELQGRFSDNAFEVRPGAPVVVEFVPFGTHPTQSGPQLASALGGKLRIEHLAQHCC